MDLIGLLRSKVEIGRARIQPKDHASPTGFWNRLSKVRLRMVEIVDH